MTSSTQDRELVVTRLIDSPRERVWQAWTEPEHLIKWWGPNGFTNTFLEIDIREGGVWRFIMHGPDGTDYPNRIVFEEITKPERITFVHGSDRDNDPGRFHSTVTFEEEGSKTRVTLRSVFATVEHLQAVKKFGAEEGGQQTLGRLEAYLKTM